MEYGIQRRSIYLVPASPEELEWMFELFDSHRQVWEMFGFDGPGRKVIEERHREGNTTIGIVKRVETGARIGFAIVFPPTALMDAWEFGFYITEGERDAFSAIHTADAMSHYMFDHLGCEPGGFRVRADNAASTAVIRRLGYRKYGTWDVGEHDYDFYRLTRARWEARRAKLVAGEETHPSPAGVAFLPLDGPPFQPVKG